MSLLTSGMMVEPVGKSPQEVGVLVTGGGGGGIAEGSAGGGRLLFREQFCEGGLTYSSTMELEMCFLRFVCAFIYVSYL